MWLLKIWSYASVEKLWKQTGETWARLDTDTYYYLQCRDGKKVQRFILRLKHWGREMLQLEVYVRPWLSSEHVQCSS